MWNTHHNSEHGYKFKKPFFLFFSCRKCYFCCNKTRNGYITNLTPETKCIHLKEGSYLYACLETEGEDVCPLNHPSPEPPNVAVTDIPISTLVPLLVGLSLFALVVILALLFCFCCWRPKQKPRQAPPEDDTLTVVKITEPDLDKDETPQDILVDAVQATTGDEQSMKGPTTAEGWGSDEDSSTDETLEIRETSRKDVPEVHPGQAARVQPEEEEPLLPDGAQIEAQSTAVQDSQKPCSPGTASSYMDQNNPETLHYDAKNQMNKLELMDANFS
ncbi:uncharacterized protein LOC106166263 [Lingula anatina]|uniref:Uncharacterized protein LOC106166263 n=1 Tax=Lingula anatina TaxID=7574 RepID=A0A1S3IPR4_LINAN|nr:uncharacterized protein LOC106166263 [Lingula anatina]|eukprot:XP_013400210.1 uncharacterized protein LOC106166263 [Lingula anatina]